MITVIAIVHILAYWYYSHQELCVRWHNTLSKWFTVGNGTRQGGILYRLFCFLGIFVTCSLLWLILILGAMWMAFYNVLTSCFLHRHGLHCSNFWMCSLCILMRLTWHTVLQQLSSRKWSTDHTVSTLYSHQPRTSSTTYETITIHMFCLSVNITSINSLLLIGVCLMFDVSFIPCHNYYFIVFYVTAYYGSFWFYSALYHARLLRVACF